MDSVSIARRERRQGMPQRKGTGKRAASPQTLHRQWLGDPLSLVRKRKGRPEAALCSSLESAAYFFFLSCIASGQGVSSHGVRSPAEPPPAAVSLSKKTSDCSQIGLRPGWRSVAAPPPEPRPFRESVQRPYTLSRFGSSPFWFTAGLIEPVALPV